MQNLVTKNRTPVLNQPLPSLKLTQPLLNSLTHKKNLQKFKFLNKFKSNTGGEVIQCVDFFKWQIENKTNPMAIQC